MVLDFKKHVAKKFFLLVCIVWVIGSGGVSGSDDSIDRNVWVFCGQSNSQGWSLLKAPIETDLRSLGVAIESYYTDGTVHPNARLFNKEPHKVGHWLEYELKKQAI